ncbi:MAG: hypothetical protein ACXU82_08095 [Caulobacteraceae bacterium]
MTLLVGKPILILATGAMLLAAGCSKPQPESTVAVAPPYNTDLPINEVMDHVMNPAGYQFWSGWGGIDDKDGYHDLTPKTDADWDRVENGATTIIVATNGIMVPGYARFPEAEWYAAAKKVANIAAEGRAAAERRDARALGDIGERLDAACDVCHAKFAIPKSDAVKGAVGPAPVKAP